MRVQIGPFRSRRDRLAFTLVEVLLAISIASALLISALLFYRQAADLRTQILVESDRLGTMRRVLDLMASDLRSAQAIPGVGDSFSGGSNWISFTRLTVPRPGPGGGLGSGSGGLTLQRVTYTAPVHTEGTNTSVAGLSRVEDSPDAARPSLPVAPSAGLDPGPFGGTNRGTVSISYEEVIAQTREEKPANLITDLVRFVRLRYWDGAAWLDGWTNSVPPPGIEIVLSTEDQATESAPDPNASAPDDLFRRVVFLPTGVAQRRSEMEGSSPAPNTTTP